MLWYIGWRLYHTNAKCFGQAEKKKRAWSLSDQFQTINSWNSQLVQSRGNSRTHTGSPNDWAPQHPSWQLCLCKQQHHWLSKQPPVRRLVLVTLEPSRQNHASKQTTGRGRQTVCKALLTFHICTQLNECLDPSRVTFLPVTLSWLLPLSQDTS